MRRIGTLPLLHQPGERWLCHTGFDILGVLLARASNSPLPALLTGRIFEPLGMRDTGFSVRSDQSAGVAAACRRDADGRLAAWLCDPEDPWQQPRFAAGGGGLLSTAADLLAFSRMMLGMGRLGPRRILARPTVEPMTTDQITPEPKAASPFVPGFWEETGWGLGLGITTHRRSIASVPGRFGWDGGFGTTWRADPNEDLAAILLIQRLMRSPDDLAINQDFLTLAYQAIED